MSEVESGLWRSRTDAAIQALELFDFHHLGTLVVPTMGTHSVWLFGLVAMRALGERLVDERVMCSAFTPPALRVSTLGIGHFPIISFVDLAGPLGPGSRVEQVVQYLPSWVSIDAHATTASHVAIDPAIGT